MWRLSHRQGTARVGSNGGARRLDGAREEVEARVDRVEALSFLVRKPIESMPQAALRWVLDNPCVSLVLTGAKSAAEVRDGARASQWPSYSQEEMDRAALLHVSDFAAA